MSHVLYTNGLVVPDDFPFVAYENICRTVENKKATHPFYEHHAGAWSGLAYRFRAALDCGDRLISLLNKYGAKPPPEERYLQEHALFDFYSSGFSAFECGFYGLYTIGSLVSSGHFPLATPRDQQMVSPARTKDAFTRAFPGDPILACFAQLFADQEFQQWREIRNILTHRAAPGRRMYISIGSDDEPPTKWKLNERSLDDTIATNGRRELTHLLSDLLDAGAKFVSARIH